MMLSVLVMAGLQVASEPVRLNASVLPPSRHAIIDGDPVTFFATLINSGAETAENCRIELTVPGAAITYRAYDAGTASFTASENVPVDIAPGGAQVFVIGASFSAALARTEYEPRYACDNGEALPVHGVTQVTLSASAQPEPDILMLASTIGTPGMVTPPVGFSGNSVFAVALTNLNGEDGVDVPLIFGADTNDRTFHVNLQVCEIDDQAQCLGPLVDQLSFNLSGRESRSFAVWVGGNFSFTPHFFDMVRHRAFVRDPGGSQLLGQTSVAHRGYSFREVCVGDIAASPWSGVIQHQTAANTEGAWSFQTRVHNLNFYSDGLGAVLAVPINRRGPRYHGQFTGPPAEEIVEPNACFDINGGLWSLSQVTGIPAPAGEPAFSGIIRRGSGAIFGHDTRAVEDRVVINSLRAFYTSTDIRTFPIQFIQQNNPPRTPASGIGGHYDASSIHDDGRLAAAGSWTVSDTAVSGDLSYTLGPGNVADCSLSLDHSGVVIPRGESGFDPNPHYRVLDGTLADCDGGDGAEGLNGTYHGLMIFQPLTSIGAFRENGLELLLSRTDGEQDYLLWFVLRSSAE